MTATPPTHDVAIIGFGPVGQLLCLLLGRKGYDVVAVERWQDPYDLPRAVHFDDEVGRIFQAAGIGDRVREITDPVPDHYEWRNRDGDALVRIDWSGTGPSGWPVANFFSQPELEAVLIEAVAKVPTAAVHRGQEVVAVHQTEDYVELTARDASGSTTAIRARYAIGADGANSFVRTQMSAAVTDLGFFYDWLIVDTVPHEERTWSPMNWQLCDPARPTTIVSGGPHRRRWEFMRLPHEDVNELNTVDAAWRLLEPWGRNPRNTTIERHTVYTFQARWADAWREHRLLLAGDAAHQMPPFAGQGMCSGLRDAINLAWKLDLVLAKVASPDLLDTYTSERSTHVQHAIGMSIALGQVICVLDEEQAAARDARMTAGGADPARVLPATPPPVLGDGVLQHDPDGQRSTSVGHLTLQHRVTHHGTTAPLDEITGGGFVVLTDGPQPLAALDETDRAFLHRIRATLLPLQPQGTPGAVYLDTDDAYLPHMREHGHLAAIVRPDFYLFGTASTPAELHQLIGQLRGHLHLLPTAPGRPPVDTAR